VGARVVGSLVGARDGAYDGAGVGESVQAHPSQLTPNCSSR